MAREARRQEKPLALAGICYALVQVPFGDPAAMCCSWACIDSCCQTNERDSVAHLSDACEFRRSARTREVADEKARVTETTLSSRSAASDWCMCGSRVRFERCREAEHGPMSTNNTFRSLNPAFCFRYLLLRCFGPNLLVN